MSIPRCMEGMIYPSIGNEVPIPYHKIINPNSKTWVLKNFLTWIKSDLGPWGPLVLAVAYIPLSILAVPASVLTLGGGYLFGLPVGFVADSTGATLGATAAFLLGRTIGRPYVKSKLKNYPRFQAVTIAIQKSGFKV
ncbi:uncharacterized protein LOC135147254 [Daucus carota subsp. sativus]|uniref:uncharacterized protein LOC135147254 n=1 Tax=Daucus carota subsp. sativus TaxID=79200 RepID=UPI003082D2A1